jgi:hypothetical protein
VGNWLARLRAREKKSIKNQQTRAVRSEASPRATYLHARDAKRKPPPVQPKVHRGLQVLVIFIFNLNMKPHSFPFPVHSIPTVESTAKTIPCKSKW